MLPVRRRPVITDEQIARELEQMQALQATVRPAQPAQSAQAPDSTTRLRHAGRSQA